MQNNWILLGMQGQSKGGEPSYGASFQAATEELVIVQEVTGKCEYSYKETPWHILTAGKTLKAGATVRSDTVGAATLKMGESAHLLKVAPGTSLELVSPKRSSSVPSGMARVRSLRGKASIYRQGGWQAMKVNSIVEPGATVMTEKRTKMDLFFPREGLVVRMKPQTIMSMKTPAQTEPPHTSRLRLSVARGGIELNRQAYLAKSH